ncbi:MAG: ISKra4 family transposase, partial [Cyanothece sp. SIO1E1]|nr:ISKra4 family transposase [Cyanothece sp. SIO1E1]
MTPRCSFASITPNWVERQGGIALTELSEQLAQQQAGELLPAEFLADSLASLPLAIAADGVMVPMRSQAKTPKGKIIWREVKVAILARLGKRVTQAGEALTQLRQRRLVAVLGDLDAFIPVLKLEAHRQSFASAPLVLWLSDGGRGF